MRKFYIVLTAFILLGVMAACSSDNNDTDEDSKEQSTAVETAKATTGELTVDRGVYGRTVPSSTTPVLLEQPGEVDGLEVKNGDKVNEDDTIATVKSAAGEQTITAPKDGTVINLEADEGSMASAEEPLTVIADLNELTLQMNVTAKVQRLFKKGETYTATAEGESYDADVSAIGLTPNDQGLYTVEASIANDDDALLTGMIVELSVPEQHVEDATLIPTSALVEESEGTFVFVVEDDVVTKTEIETSEIQSDQTAVKSGIEDGDEVVTSGQLSLSDDSKVNVVKEGESS